MRPEGVVASGGGGGGGASGRETARWRGLRRAWEMSARGGRWTARGGVRALAQLDTLLLARAGWLGRRCAAAAVRPSRVLLLALGGWLVCQLLGVAVGVCCNIVGVLCTVFEANHSLRNDAAPEDPTAFPTRSSDGPLVAPRSGEGSLASRRSEGEARSGEARPAAERESKRQAAVAAAATPTDVRRVAASQGRLKDLTAFPADAGPRKAGARRRGGKERLARWLEFFMLLSLLHVLEALAQRVCVLPDSYWLVKLAALVGVCRSRRVSRMVWVRLLPLLTRVFTRPRPAGGTAKGAAPLAPPRDAVVGAQSAEFVSDAAGATFGLARAAVDALAPPLSSSSIRPHPRRAGASLF